MCVWSFQKPGKIGKSVRGCLTGTQVDWHLHVVFSKKKKQEAHGPHMSTEKQIQSKYTFTQILKRKIIWRNLNPLHKGMLCDNFGWNLPNGSADFFLFRLFVIIISWKKTWSFIWTNLNLLHRRILSAKFSWVLKFCQYMFTLSLLSPLGTGFTWTNLKPLYQRMICTKFVPRKMYQMSIFAIISLGKWRGPSFENIHPLHKRMLCDKFGWN